MPKPHGRKTRKKVEKILMGACRETAMEMLMQIPDAQLVGHLFSHFYHKDELIKFRSIAAMGCLGARVAQKNMEKARIILRRIMWNLNDESGGIGWGSPEAMGEILSKSPDLAMEFNSILFSYLDSKGNFIEHEMLQRGVLWGIGTYLGKNPFDLNNHIEKSLSRHLQSRDPVKRAYAFRSLSNARCFDSGGIPDHLVLDHHRIELFTGWNFLIIPISEMILSNEGHKIFV